jgi:hypothetical protein
MNGRKTLFSGLSEWVCVQICGNIQITRNMVLNKVTVKVLNSCGRFKELEDAEQKSDRNDSGSCDCHE